MPAVVGNAECHQCWFRMPTAVGPNENPHLPWLTSSIRTSRLIHIEHHAERCPELSDQARLSEDSSSTSALIALTDITSV
jgi:hypothetical protein